MPSSASPSTSPIRSARLRSTRRGDLVLVVERLHRGGLRRRVAEERLAHLVDRRPQLVGAAQRVADAQPAEPVDLRERAQQHEVRVLLQQVDRVGGVLEQAELDVGLVEDHADVPRDAGHELRDLVQRQRGRGRVVRVADDQQPGGGGDLLAHRFEVVAMLGVERDLDRPGAGRGGQVRVDRERRPRVDDLGARLEQRVAGGEQDVAGAVADRDPRGRHLVDVGQPAPQRGVRRVRVAVRALQRGGGRLDHGGDRRVRRLVGGQLRDRPLGRVAVGGRVDRDAADPLGELQGHRARKATRGAAAGPRSR